MTSPVVGVVLMLGLTVIMPVSVVVWMGDGGGNCFTDSAGVSNKRVELRGCHRDPCLETRTYHKVIDGEAVPYQGPAWPELTRCKEVWNELHPDGYEPVETPIGVVDGSANNTEPDSPGLGLGP